MDTKYYITFYHKTEPRVVAFRKDKVDLLINMASMVVKEHGLNIGIGNPNVLPLPAKFKEASLVNKLLETILEQLNVEGNTRILVYEDGFRIMEDSEAAPTFGADEPKVEKTEAIEDTSITE